MRQQDYDNITTCIQFGAPALATDLLTSFNQTVENSNKYLQEQKRLVDEARRAEEANKANEAMKNLEKPEKPEFVKPNKKE